MADPTSSPSPADRANAILALDGGGVRGAISIAFLQRLETLLRARDDAPDARLSDYFDLIGGTSTGAIIAGAMALGQQVTEIHDAYRALAPRVFQRPPFRVAGLQAVFDANRLRQEIRKVCGDQTLETADLKSCLAVVTKRMDTGSIWVVTSNPDGAFWDDDPAAGQIGNRHYRLADIIRASTAAPHFFEPEEIAIVDGQSPGLFIDGAISPHNNPSLALLCAVTIPGHGFSWPTGRERLAMVSIGTGSFRPQLDALKARSMTSAGLAIRALSGMIADGEQSVLTQMQLLAATDTPWVINSEIGDLGGFRLTPEPLLTYQRYNIRLDGKWLIDELATSLSGAAIDRLKRIDDPGGLEVAFELGQLAAEKFMIEDHLTLVRRREKAG
ncbi:MAG: patatin-like phospholipase family protein [Pseudomonadota bacterium]